MGLKEGLHISKPETVVFKLAINVKGFICPLEQNICQHETLLENKVLFVNLGTYDQLLG